MAAREDNIFKSGEMRAWRNTKFGWDFPGLSDVSRGHILHSPGEGQFSL